MFDDYHGKADYEWAVKLHRFSLEGIGLWPKPDQAKQRKYVHNFYPFFVFLTIAFFFVLPAMHSLIKTNGDIMLMIDNLQYTLPAVTCLLKIVIFWWKKDGPMQLVRMMSDDWGKPKSPWEETIMIRRVQTARLIITISYVLMIIAVSIIIFSPAFGISITYQGSNITDSGRPLPLQIYYIYDVTKNPQYVLTFVAQGISSSLCAMAYSGVDNFMSMVLFHILGQLDILSHNLMDLKSVGDFNNALKRCVTDHDRLLSAIVIIKDTFDKLLLILFIYFGTLFAFYGFLVINVCENVTIIFMCWTEQLFEDGHFKISDLVFLLTLMVNTFGHMCVYCSVGDLLATQCDQVHYAIYCNKWYAANPRHMRDIVLLMIRSGKPLYLTAGKIFPLTMATFCNLLKTSAGYISILLATRK